MQIKVFEEVLSSAQLAEVSQRCGLIPRSSGAPTADPGPARFHKRVGMGGEGGVAKLPILPLTLSGDVLRSRRGDRGLESPHPPTVDFVETSCRLAQALNNFRWQML